jgi:tRNA-dihydrouridine synthase A
VIHGDRERLLGSIRRSIPSRCSSGGSDPEALARADGDRGRGYGYDEINLNVGCPSDRVQSGCFGAVLMERPASWPIAWPR